MIQSGLFSAAGQADLDLTEGPDAAPTNCSSYTWGADKVGVQWTNGDTEAETQIALTDDANDDPGAEDVQFTAPAGATSWNSSLNANLENNRCAWWVRHVRNGQFSDWSSAGLHVDGCDPPISGGGDDGTQL